MKPIDKVLAKLERVRPSGDGYVACCPAHDDRTPSLSIREGDDGRVLIHCFAGCSTEQVLAALGLEMRDLFPDTPTPPARVFSPPAIRAPRPTSNGHPHGGIASLSPEEQDAVRRRAMSILNQPRELTEAQQLASAQEQLDQACDEIYHLELRNRDLKKQMRQAGATPVEEAVPTAAASLLVIKPANQWLLEASKRPIPRMLFDEFWFEGELCILFADTNVGKTALAVQIADSITTGLPVAGFRFDAEPQQVLYFDFELSGKQFEKRYSANYTDHFHFDERFLRVELNPDTTFEGEWDKGVRDAIEDAAISTGAKRLIVDNITYLKNETERAKYAMPLMRHLSALKKRHGLSIMALAHTPKRDPQRPIARNDLAGSRSILQFADACFAIGESHLGDGLRYLKQIKVRSGEHCYGADNVMVCRLEKPRNFLGYHFEGNAGEAEHLKPRTASEAAALDADIVALKQAEPHLSNREIARRLNTSHPKVGRVLKRNALEVEQGGTGGTPGTPVPPVPGVPPNGDGLGAYDIEDLEEF